jgi:peptidoglycan hydrolase-like protein with peptidoglycan-binding domain
MSHLRQALAALTLGAMIAACGGVRRAETPDTRGAETAAQKPEAPDRPSDRGVAPEGGRPRVPAAPEALLAEGAVTEIQTALTDRGLLKAHAKGELDEATSKALRAFQADQGLAETGFPDRETLARLGVDPDRAYGRAEDEPRARSQ